MGSVDSKQGVNMAITVTFNGSDFTAGSITALIIEKIQEAMRRSLPAIARVWSREAQRLAPLGATGRLRRTLRIFESGGRLRIRFIFYTPAVRARQGAQDFLLRAWQNIRSQVISIIRFNFSLLS